MARMSAVDQTGRRPWLFRQVEWVSAPTHSIAGVMELYEQLLPTRVYAAYKTGSSHQINTICRMCGKVSKSLAHVLPSLFLRGNHGWSPNGCASQKMLKHTGMFLFTQNTLSVETTG